MKILLVGAGGREHALAWKIAQSPLLSKLYCAPGNPGMTALNRASSGDTGPEISRIALSGDDIEGLVAFAASTEMDLVIIGPEAPLAAGIADALRAVHIPCFGPGRDAARLESSKGFVKDLCAAHHIPTARYGRFQDPEAAIAFLDTVPAPYVIKADGLAAGKGVVITHQRETAEASIRDMLGGQFGTASAEIVIEEFLEGEEASFFALCDGTRLVPMIPAQDHKRAFDGDKGPNTGGMGAYAPAPIMSDALSQEVMETILLPTIRAMQGKGTPYIGVLYAGLMITRDGPKLIEYNARFGDPECQILMRLLKSDIVPALLAAARGDLSQVTLDWSAETAALIVLAAKGYPGDYKKGTPIKNLEAANTVPGVETFHAGTDLQDGILRANGGRVLNVTACALSGAEALRRAYAAVELIDWPDGFYRKDIGWRLRTHETSPKTSPKTSPELEPEKTTQI